ncbi:hypothetical protein BV20DRAFT_581239 [Pilatotrama ljubarskyi]|nr:hypothetical protein BV20DRAFT_581239 [Pilatotrama ljubarskyi]
MLSPSRSPSPPRAVARGSRASSRNAIDRQLRETSVRHFSPRHAPRDTKDVPSGVGPSRDSRSDGRYLSHHSTGRRSRSRGTSTSGGVGCEQLHFPPSSRNSRHPGNKYDGKGKRRAEDRADDLDSSRPASSHDEEVMTARGDPDAGMQRNVNNSMPSRARSENEATSSTLSTPPRTTDLSAAISQSAKSSSPASPVASPIRDSDKATNPGELPSMSDESGLPIVSRKEGKAPVRVRRNPWQTMQDYLSNGINGSRSSRHGDRTFGAELTSQAQSQAQGDAGGSSPSDEAVPSLLLRLLDPSPPTPTTSHYASSEVPDAVRRRLPTHEEGKGISAPEIMARTRARLARMSAVDDRTVGSSPPPNVQHPGAGCQSDHNRNAVQGGDVGAVEHMSSENAAQPKGGTGTARISAEATPLVASADPRSLLLQKLAAEKRDAADIPTAEKAQLSSARRSSVPMVLSDGSAGEPSKSAPDVVAAERIAERREAELRSQAQLRVRLAAAKRAANATATPAVQDSGAAVEGGVEGSSATIDGDLAAQESSLRSRLRSRQR